MDFLDRAHWALLGALQEEGTLSAAAATLGITQSAATQRLREAERRLGVPLARKQGRRLVLTEAGDTIARADRQSRPILRRAESEAIWHGKRMERRLRLAWGVFDPPALAQRIISLCGHVDPSVSIEIARIGQDGLVPSLLNGSADFGLFPGPVAPSRAALRRLFADRLVAVFPKADAPGSVPVTPEAFAGRPYLTFGLRPEPGWEYDTFFDRGRRFPARAVKIESTELICARVAGGGGASILPRLCVESSTFSGALSVHELDMAPLEFEWHMLHGPDLAADMVDLVGQAASNARAGPSAMP